MQLIASSFFRKLLIISSLLIIPFLLTAQIGVNVAYGNSQPKAWQPMVLDNDLTSYSLGVDYWFRLPNRRVEFLPEINFANIEYNNTAKNSTDGIVADAVLTNKAYSFYFNTNLYLLDFDSDCDCPTWEKDGSFIEKGLFLQLSPGISYHALRYIAFDGSEDAELTATEIAYSIGAGVGLDLGISKALTITPFYRMRYFPSVTFENLIETFPDIANAENTTTNMQWEAGIRLGYRWTDERTLQTRRRNKRMSKQGKKKKKRK